MKAMMPSPPVVERNSFREYTLTSETNGQRKSSKLSFTIDSIVGSKDAHLSDDSKDSSLRYLKSDKRFPLPASAHLTSSASNQPNVHQNENVRESFDSSSLHSSSLGLFPINGQHTQLPTPLSPLSLLQLRIPVPVNSSSVSHYIDPTFGYSLNQVRPPSTVDVLPYLFSRHQPFQGKFS